MATTIFLVNPQTFPITGFTNTNSLLYDGVNEYVDCGTISELNGATNISVSYWIKLSDLSYRFPWGTYTASTNAFYSQMFSVPGTRDITFDVRGASGTEGYCAYSFSTNVWYHIVMIYDGGGATNADKAKIYINGVNQTLTFVGTMPSSLGTNTDSFDIGRAINSNYFNGYIDEFAIFDHSLTSGNVTSLYNSGTPTDLDNTSGVTAPVHWWRMGDGDTFPTINDVGTTGGNNGTMTNMESGDIVTDTP